MIDLKLRSVVCVPMYLAGRVIGAWVAALAHEQEARNRKREERHRDSREEERLVVGAEGESYADGKVGAEIADANSNAGYAPPVLFGRHVGQERVVLSYFAHDTEEFWAMVAAVGPLGPAA